MTTILETNLSARSRLIFGSVWTGKDSVGHPKLNRWTKVVVVLNQVQISAINNYLSKKTCVFSKNYQNVLMYMNKSVFLQHIYLIQKSSCNSDKFQITNVKFMCVKFHHELSRHGSIAHALGRV